MKIKPQNMGTKVRTILAVLVTIHTVLAMTDVTQFGNEKVDLIYKILSALVNAGIIAINTWYNNDYSEEAARHTGNMRQEKREKNSTYIGDKFYEEYTHDYEEEVEEDRGGEPDTLVGDDDE